MEPDTDKATLPLYGTQAENDRKLWDQAAADMRERAAKCADNARRPVGYTYLMGQIADEIAHAIRKLPLNEPK